MVYSINTALRPMSTRIIHSFLDLLRNKLLHTLHETASTEGNCLYVDWILSSQKKFFKCFSNCRRQPCITRSDESEISYEVCLISRYQDCFISPLVLHNDFFIFRWSSSFVKITEKKQMKMEIFPVDLALQVIYERIILAETLVSYENRCVFNDERWWFTNWLNKET